MAQAYLELAVLVRALEGLSDAARMVTRAGIPLVEVHISNVHAREAFRHHSYLSDKAVAVIVGCGVQGYEFALRRLAALAATR